MKSILLISLLSLFIFSSCSQNEVVCTQQYDPVCGVDGKTYSNACHAGDVKIVHKGACSYDCGINPEECEGKGI